jgi:hypothetical protein
MGRKAARRRERNAAAKAAARRNASASPSGPAVASGDGPWSHEAVHAVAAAVLMGADQIATVSADPAEGALGGWLELVDDAELSAAGADEARLDDLPVSLVERAQARLVMHLAGTFDSEVDGGRPPAPPTAYASDRANAHELALLLASWDEAGTPAILERADAQARAFVVGHRPEILAMAQALKERHSLSGLDVAEVLRSVARIPVE